MNDEKKDDLIPIEPPHLADQPATQPSVERTPTIYEQAMEELGFTEDEKLQELRDKLTRLVRATPEPQIPDTEYDDIEYPEEIVTLMGEYQATAETIIDQIPDSPDHPRARAQIALILSSGRILYEGGWQNVFRRNSYIEDAHDYANNMGVQYPELFDRIAQATRNPYH